MSGSVLLSSTLLLAVFFGSMYREKRQAYLWVWSIAWLLVSASLAITLAGHQPALAAGTTAPGNTIAPWAMAMRDWFLVLASLTFLGAARLYASQNPWTQRLFLIGTGAAVWAVGYSRGWVTLPMSLAAGVLLLVVARTFLYVGHKQESKSDSLLALTFAAWGVLVLLSSLEPWIPSLAGRHLRSFVIVPQFFAGVVMVMGVYEEQR